VSVKDAARFEQDITSILPDLYGTALRFARNPADAEDLVAQTVATAWAALHTLHDVTRFRAWVIRILTNTYYANLRAESVRPRAEPLPDECADEFSIFDRLHQPFLLWWGNPERELLDRILREDMERAITALPEPFRPVVVLADL